jgi:hypothetical protein
MEQGGWPLIHSVLAVVPVLLVELVHQDDVNVNENDKNVDGALLSEPKAELGAANFDGVQGLYQENPKYIRDKEPYGKQNAQINQVLFPVLLSFVVVGHKPEF